MDKQASKGHTRREVLARAAYVAPAILTLVASPSFAQTGSFAPVRPNGVPTTIYPPGFNTPPGMPR